MEYILKVWDFITGVVVAIVLSPFKLIRYIIQMFPTWMVMILYENGKLSMTNLFAFMLTISFLIVSFYLLVTQAHFEYYSEFSSIAAGGGLATKLGNKAMNSAWNSPQGESPKLYSKD